MSKLTAMIEILRAIQPAGSNEEIDAYRTQLEDAEAARSTLEGLGVPTEAIDDKIAALNTKLTEADGERISSLTALDAVISTASFVRNRLLPASDQKPYMLAGGPEGSDLAVFASWFGNAKVVAPDAVEQNPLSGGGHRAPKGARKRQVVQMFMHLSKGGKRAVSLNGLAARLSDSDPGFGDVDAVKASVSQIMSKFADVFYSNGEYSVHQ